MMRWGRKKPSSASISSSSSSSSHPHLISHVFPLSWFSKSKQPNPKPTSRIEKFNQKGKQNGQKMIPKSPKCLTSTYQHNRFYTQDDDGFWKLSFGDQDHAIEDDHSKLVVPQHYCGNCKSNIKQPATKRRSRKSNKNHSDQEQREVSSKEAAKDESLRRTYRRIIEATSELQRELDEVTEGCRKSVEKEMQEIELLQAMQMMGRVNSDSRKQRHVSSRESESFHLKEEDENEETRAEWQKLKEAKMKVFLAKSEKQRKSFHIGRDSQRKVSRQGKVRVQSPRTPSKTETCKIKALEDLKKLKMKKKMKEIASLEDKAAALDSFAVVKCSRNPQQDFRDSMLEMITEKRIRRPEELEELLACYLTLNADEYHDLIIKVFRQVWFELEDAYFDQKSAEEHYCDV